MLRNIQEYMEDRRLLASAALFRQLHENKKDVYDVLAQFIRSSISWSSTWSFNVTECSGILEKYFGFRIPDAVIRTCLKRRLKRAGELSLNQGIYSITDTFVKADSLKEEYTNTQKEQLFIINTLITYVEKIKDKQLSTPEKQQLSSDFHSYFLGGVRCDNDLLISEFIVKYSNDQTFTEKLNRVEEGLILYTGICHTSNFANHEPWRSNFTIFLDTEVLFYSQGFNGTLHQKIFNDFHGLVKEINTRTTTGGKIELRYFDEAKREVDDFFYAAERIVEQRQEPAPSKPAMINIVNGCKYASDVVLKKAKFYDELRKLRIQEEISHNYYDPPTYVIDSASNIHQLRQEHPELDQDKIPDILRLFTKINYLRLGASDQGLEQSSAILASGKNITRVLAFAKPVLAEPKQIPFATDLDYLTERLWFKLNKGFGDGKQPTSFDVVAHAQIILSTQAGNRVAEDYKSLLNQVKTGEMSHDSAGFLLSELRSRTTKPEDFRPETIEELTAFLHTEFIENALREKSALEQQARDGEQSKKQVDLLKEQLAKKIEESKQQSARHQEESSSKLSLFQTTLRNRDISWHKDKLRPLRLIAELEYVGFMVLAYGLAILSGLALITSLVTTSDSPLTIVSVILGLIPLAIMLLSSKLISKFFSKRVRARYLQRLRNKLVIPLLSSYSTDESNQERLTLPVKETELLGD